MTRKYDLPRNNLGRRWITTITYSLLHNSNLLLSVTMDTAPRFSLILITSFITRNRHLDSSFPSYHLLQSWNLITRYVSRYRHLLSPLSVTKKKIFQIKRICIYNFYSRDETNNKYCKGKENQTAQNSNDPSTVERTEYKRPGQAWRSFPRVIKRVIVRQELLSLREAFPRRFRFALV